MLSIAFEFIIMGLLLLICIQDFRERSVYAILFPILAIFLILFSSSKPSLSDYFTDSAINLIFLFSQGICLYIWLKVKHKSDDFTLMQYIGLGDAFFYLSIAFAFSWFNFMLFYSIGLIITLIVVGIQNVFSVRQWKNIPLAGIQAGWLIIVLIIKHILQIPNLLYSDKLFLFIYS